MQGSGTPCKGYGFLSLRNGNKQSLTKFVETYKNYRMDSKIRDSSLGLPLCELFK